MSQTKTPLFSVIIPTFRRPHALEKLMSSLTSQVCPARLFEVIVVDDGGHISLESILFPYRKHFDLILIEQKNAGPGAARNRGAKRAKGQILVFTDDDCCANSSWIEELYKIYVNLPHCLCGGRTINHYRENPFSQATQMLMDFLSKKYNPSDEMGGFYPTNNFAVPRDRFLKLGGFDSSLRFGEDRDFCRRWAACGYPFRFASNAIVYHYHFLNFFSFIQLHFFYGGGTFHFWKKSKAFQVKRNNRKFIVFFGQLLLSGKSDRNRFKGLIYSLLFIVMQLANFSGMFWQAVKNLISQKTR